MDLQAICNRIDFLERLIMSQAQEITDLKRIVNIDTVEPMSLEQPLSPLDHSYATTQTNIPPMAPTPMQQVPPAVYTPVTTHIPLPPTPQYIPPQIPQQYIPPPVLPSVRTPPPAHTQRHIPSPEGRENQQQVQRNSDRSSSDNRPPHSLRWIPTVPLSHQNFVQEFNRFRQQSRQRSRDLRYESANSDKAVSDIPVPPATKSHYPKEKLPKSMPVDDLKEYIIRECEIYSEDAKPESSDDEDGPAYTYITFVKPSANNSRLWRPICDPKKSNGKHKSNTSKPNDGTALPGQNQY